MAGPIYRLEKTLEYLAEGDLTQTIRFRHYDPLKDVEHTLNNAFKEFSQRVKAVEEAYDNMDKMREKLSTRGSSIEKFKEKLNALEKEIKKFKI